MADDEDDLEKDILKSATEIGAKDGPDDEVEDEEGAQEAPEPSEGDEQGERPRDESGKFVKGKASVKAGDAPQIPAAPDTWSQLDKDRYAAIPDPLKPLYLEHRTGLEKQFGEKEQQIASWQQERQALDQIFAPIANELALHGVQRVDAIRRLVGAHQLLTRDPMAGVQWLAKSYGVDLSKLGGQQQSDDAAWLDPMAEKTYGVMDQRFGKLENAIQQLIQGQQSQQTSAVDMAIANFAGARNADGSAKYPYFSNVRDRMIVELRVAAQMGQQMTLEQAYENAVSLHPEISKTRLAQRQAEEAKKKEAERKAHLAKAKAAEGTRTVSSASPGKPGKSKGKIQDDVASAWDELAGAA